MDRPMRIWCEGQGARLVPVTSETTLYPLLKCTRCNKIAEYYHNFWDTHQVRDELVYTQGWLFPEKEMKC